MFCLFMQLANFSIQIHSFFILFLDCFKVFTNGDFSKCCNYKEIEDPFSAFSSFCKSQFIFFYYAVFAQE